MERKRIIVITPEERKYLQKMIGCSGVTVWEAVKYRKSNDIHKRIRKRQPANGNRAGIRHNLYHQPPRR